jgi:hypothetical protein
VGVVLAPLAVEIALAVAPRAGRIARTVFRAKTVHARPRLQRHAVDRKMLARQQALHFALRQHRGKELLRHLAREQPVAVLRECRGVPHWVLNTQPDKPAEQQIVISPLDQLPLPSGSNRRPAGAAPASPAPAGSSPIGEYSSANSPVSAASAAFAISRITRSG